MNSRAFPPLLLYSPLCAYGLLENMISAKSKPLLLSLINFTCGSSIRFYFGLPILFERGLSPVSFSLGRLLSLAQFLHL